MTTKQNGFYYILEGFRLINRAKLRRFVIIPLLCNIILFIGLFALSIHYMHDAVSWFDALLPSWLDWLNWLLWPLFIVAFFLIMYYTFTILANLIASPFNALLSERTQKYLNNTVPPETSMLQLIIKETPRSLMRQLTILAYYVPRALVLLILFLIPVINAIAPILWFIFNAWFMAVQYVDYPMDNNKVSFKQLRRDLRRRPFINLGFGACVSILNLIPIINLAIMPAAVIGATVLWVGEYQESEATTDQKNTLN